MTDAAHRLRGIVLFLIALLLFAALDATAKYLSAVFAVPLLVWARYMVHCVFMLATVAPSLGRQLVVTKHPWLLAVRALLLVGVTLLGQLALEAHPRGHKRRDRRQAQEDGRNIRPDQRRRKG